MTETPKGKATSCDCLLGPDCPSRQGAGNSTCDYLAGTWYVTRPSESR